MALFHANKVALNFELAGRRFIVPLGDEFEVPERYAYVIKAHGIQAAAGASSKEGAARVRSVPNGHKAPAPRIDDDEKVSIAEAREELAAATGEDDPVEDDDDLPPSTDADGEDISDGDAAERTMQQLEAQGIRVPGKRPGRKAK